MSRRSSWAATCVVAVAAVALSGCGGGSSEEPGTTASAGSATQVSTPATQTSAPDAATSAAATKTPADDETPAKAKLDAYVADGRRQVKAAMSDAMRQTYSDVRVEPVYPSGVEFVYVFRKQVDAAVASGQLEKSAPVLDATFDTQIAPEMKAEGLEHPSATWTYLNPDGSRVWRHTAS